MTNIMPVYVIAIKIGQLYPFWLGIGISFSAYDIAVTIQIAHLRLAFCENI